MKKKILSLMLAMVMMLSLSVTALADGEAETVSITKLYNLVGDGTSPEETFYLVQVGDGVVVDGEGEATDLIEYTGSTGETLPTVESNETIVAAVEFSEGDATANDDTGKNFTITLPSYEKVGIYKYTLKEVTGSTAGVEYYGDEFYLVVTVTNEIVDGKLTGNKVVNTAVHTESDWDGTANNAEKTDEIENTYSAGSLSITKTVTGNGGDTSQYFKITVTLTAESDDLDYATEFESNLDELSSKDNPTSIKLSENVIYLKDGETLTIENIPYGVTYTVVEADYTGNAADEGYDAAKYSVNEGTATAKSVSGEDLDDAEETVEITNNKETEVDMGVYLDNLPYILMLIVVAAGVVVMISRRRLNEKF